MRGKGRRGEEVVRGGWGVPSGAGRLARRAGASEAPAIDQKFMSAAGIRPCVPSAGFHLLSWV